jgi:hypothetical protein
MGSHLVKINYYKIYKTYFHVILYMIVYIVYDSLYCM